MHSLAYLHPEYLVVYKELCAVPLRSYSANLSLYQEADSSDLG